METHRLILPSDLNQYGFLFGGRLLAWVDEASWIAATLDFPGRRVVTVATILAIRCEKERTGTTSATYAVRVFDQNATGEPIFSTRVTFVNVDAEGRKQPL